KPERRVEEPLRCGAGVERGGALAGVAEGAPRGLTQLAAVQPGSLAKLERLQVVVREQLGLLGRPAERLDPLRRAAVQLRAQRTRDLPVRDVADEHVAERVLVLACDRRPARTLHELLPLERVQQLLGVPASRSLDGGDRTEP